MDQNNNQTPGQSPEVPIPPESQPNYQTFNPVQPVASPQVVNPQPSFAQPAAPVMPAPQVSTVMSQSQPGGAPKKGLIIGLIVGGVLLVAGLIAAALLLSGPTKDDYKKASTTASDLASAYSAMNMVYLSTSATETEIKNDLGTLKTNREKFNTKFSELKEMKAVSRDKEVDEAYKAATDKKAKLDASLDAQMEAFEEILPVVRKISEGSSSVNDVSDFLELVTDIRGDLQALELKATVNKDYVDTLVRDLKKLEALIPKVQASRDDYTKYDSKVTSDFYDTISDLSKDDRDWQSNMEKLQDDGEMKDELNKIQDVLMDKSVQ